MTIGQLIDKLIWVNIQTWHKDSPVRRRNELKVPLTNQEIGEMTVAGRKLNNERTEIRCLINKFFKEDIEDRKINYTPTKDGDLNA